LERTSGDWAWYTELEVGGSSQASSSQTPTSLVGTATCATGSGAYSGYPYSKLYDGTISGNGYCSSTTGSSWVELCLDNTYSVSSVLVTPVSNSMGYLPTTVKVCTQSGGSGCTSCGGSWSKVDTSDGWNWYAVQCPDSASGSYLRMEKAGGNWFWITEVELSF
jgi:hypothetical protein